MEVNNAKWIGLHVRADVVGGVLEHKRCHEVLPAIL